MLDANHRGDVDASFDALQRIYDEAVCTGGTLSARPAQDERLHSPLELLAAITSHTPYLALIVVELAGAGDAAPDCLARETRRHTALVIRLAHRALEVHARDVGYELDAWRRRAVLEASVALTVADAEDRGDELGAAAAGLADAAAALAAAITAVSTDRMAVPDHLASALSRWLACYARADRAALGR
jgi:hypothetical protein